MDMIELTPCNTFGNSKADMWHDGGVLTIGRGEPYFSLVIFPQYSDKSGNRVSLTDVRNGKEHKGYDEEAFAVSSNGTMIEHRRGWKRLR